MGLLKEFKEFAMRGNVVDLAVGVIIGGAFGKIVTSLVNDVLTPGIAIALNKVGITGKFDELNAFGITYGKFVQATFDFIIVAACVFAMIKLMNAVMKKKEEAPAAPPPPPADVVLLQEIRDLLAKR